MNVERYIQQLLRYLHITFNKVASYCIFWVSSPRLSELPTDWGQLIGLIAICGKKICFSYCICMVDWDFGVFSVHNWSGNCFLGHINFLDGRWMISDNTMMDKLKFLTHPIIRMKFSAKLKTKCCSKSNLQRQKKLHLYYTLHEKPTTWFI